MATDIYSMLTGGYDPRVEQMKQQQLFQQNLSQATTPQSFIATVGSNFGNVLGQGAQRLLGVKDPREEKAIKTREALEKVKARGIDQKDQSAFLSAVAEELQAVGLTAEAMKASEAAQSAKVRSYELSGFENKQLLQETISKIPPETPPEQRELLINNAIRQFGTSEQQLALSKEEMAKAKAVKATTNRASALVSTLGDKVDNETILAIAGDPELYRKVMDDRLKIREQKTKVVTTKGGVWLVEDPSGKKIKYYGLPSSGITIQNKQESEELGARGKLLVKQYDDVSEQAKVSLRTRSVLQTNLDILERGFNTGFGTETKAAAASVLATLGLKDASKYAANAQMFNAAVNQIVLQAQLAQKGPQTEADARRITDTTAKLGNEKEANKFILKVAIAQANKDIKQRDFYSKWFTKYKTYDGAEDAWYESEGGESIFNRPELKQYAQGVKSKVDEIPTATGTPRSAEPLSDEDLINKYK